MQTLSGMFHQGFTMLALAQKASRSGAGVSPDLNIAGMLTELMPLS
jgi:hypothetical protein